jgi:hypothetical protein
VRLWYTDCCTSMPKRTDKERDRESIARLSHEVPEVLTASRDFDAVCEISNSVRGELAPRVEPGF